MRRFEQDWRRLCGGLPFSVLRRQWTSNLLLTIRLDVPTGGPLTKGNSAIAVGPDDDHGTATCDTAFTQLLPRRFEMTHLESSRMDDPNPLLRCVVSLGGPHKYPNVAAYIAAQPKFDAAISPDDGPAIVSLHRQCESASSVSNLSTQGPADSQVSVLVVSSCNPVTHIA